MPFYAFNLPACIKSFILAAYQRGFIDCASIISISQLEDAKCSGVSAKFVTFFSLHQYNKRSLKLQNKTSEVANFAWYEIFTFMEMTTARVINSWQIHVLSL